ncbi:carboxypeptidase-like regulatory domain-containing protein [Zunongwangia pacifica]|uniref:Carboxypeptidase-like regulatory domain-containing protein n=1 Tax=Zunongwangia pacifica TaxID=2911062 RepID=A0A9X2CP49_9FLAO|nr:carboxypeptidase-like regulatory domain-containing protein [Zunongwangia pacifica]MCL6217668.1 carboxypeptidase-like regulatory domain-containing protein [Zunongwangia pacifica]
MKNIAFLLLFITLPLKAQKTYTGRVLSAKDSTVLQGVSIYFDGTSLGTTSNAEGYFKIKNTASNISPLIFRSIGYTTRTIPNISIFEDENYPVVFLEESVDQLETVVLETDPWTRAHKISVFRREFLGKTKAASKCKILNEDAIKLKYSPSNSELIAYANEPILIENKHLGYVIEYELMDFTVKYSIGSSGLQLVDYTFYEGSSFFKELKEKPKKRFLKNREDAFKGSLLQFMRALSKKQLAEHHFKIFYDQFEVSPYRYFDIQPEANFTKVTMLAEKISILYDHQQSSIIYKNPFYIDQFGNFAPTRAFSISGFMGQSRMANLLPSNYGL